MHNLCRRLLKCSSCSLSRTLLLTDWCLVRFAFASPCLCSLCASVCFFSRQFGFGFASMCFVSMFKFWDKCQLLCLCLFIYCTLILTSAHTSSLHPAFSDTLKDVSIYSTLNSGQMGSGKFIRIITQIQAGWFRK